MQNLMYVRQESKGSLRRDQKGAKRAPIKSRSAVQKHQQYRRILEWSSVLTCTMVSFEQRDS